MSGALVEIMFMSGRSPCQDRHCLLERVCVVGALLHPKAIACGKLGEQPERMTESLDVALPAGFRLVEGEKESGARRHHCAEAREAGRDVRHIEMCEDR